MKKSVFPVQVFADPFYLIITTEE